MGTRASLPSIPLLPDGFDEERAAARAAAAARRSAALTVLLDLACWFVGLLFALAIRFGFDPPWERLRAVLLFAPLALVLQALVGDFVGVYRHRGTRPRFDDLVGVAIATIVTTIATAGFNWVLDPSPVPLSVPLGGGFLALLGVLAVRSVRRAFNERRRDANEAVS